MKTELTMAIIMMKLLFCIVLVICITACAIHFEKLWFMVFNIIPMVLSPSLSSNRRE